MGTDVARCRCLIVVVAHAARLFDDDDRFVPQ